MGTDTATPTKEKRMETNVQLVTLKGNSTITNSLIVAEVFGKNHYDVLRDIRSLQSDISDGVAKDHQRSFALMIEARRVTLQTPKY